MTTPPRGEAERAGRRAFSGESAISLIRFWRTCESSDVSSIRGDHSINRPMSIRPLRSMDQCSMSFEWQWRYGGVLGKSGCRKSSSSTQIVCSRRARRARLVRAPTSPRSAERMTLKRRSCGSRPIEGIGTSLTPSVRPHCSASSSRRVRSDRLRQRVDIARRFEGGLPGGGV